MKFLWWAWATPRKRKRNSAAPFAVNQECLKDAQHKISTIKGNGMSVPFCRYRCPLLHHPVKPQTIQHNIHLVLDAVAQGEAPEGFHGDDGDAPNICHYIV